MRIRLNKNDNLSAAEIITILSLVTSPFTAFRFRYLGVSEIMIIVLILYAFAVAGLKLPIQRDSLFKHFFLFIVCCLVGWAYNILADINSGTTYYALFNLFAYALTALGILSVEILLLYRESVRFRTTVILRCFFLLLSIIILILFFISRRTRFLFGKTLFYYNRFVPFADNIHQFSMIAVFLPFVGFYFAKKETRAIKKLLYILLGLFDIYIVLGVDALKATVGIIIGCAVLFILLVAQNERISQRNKKIIITCFVMLAAVVAILRFDDLITYGIRFFYENDNHGARRQLYTEAISIILNKSPLVGLGPSLHVYYGASYGDAHETFLTAALSGGIFGLITILLLYWKAIKQTINNAFCFSGFIPVIVYSLGGDMLRKASVWMMVVLLGFVASQKDDILLS